jgi:hypothetical protein
VARSETPDDPQRRNPARSGNPARRAQAARTPTTRATGPEQADRAGSDRRLKFPHRDARGRVDTLPDLILGVLVWLLVALVILALFDGVLAALGQSFGRTSGWICGVLAVWLFTEEYRAWRPVSGRPVVALLGVLIGGAMGLAVAGLASALPAMVSGFLGVAVATLAYAVLWYSGVRILARRSGQE